MQIKKMDKKKKKKKNKMHLYETMNAMTQTEHHCSNICLAFSHFFFSFFFPPRESQNTPEEELRIS